jgi:hypothetical protein
MDSEKCTLTFDLTSGSYSSGSWYAAAIQIEDFNSTSSTTAFSSVPVQFLISIDSSGASCKTPYLFKKKFN